LWYSSTAYLHPIIIVIWFVWLFIATLSAPSVCIYLSYQLSTLNFGVAPFYFRISIYRWPVRIVRNCMILWNFSFQLTLISHERFCCWKDCLILFSPFFYLIWFSNFHVSYDKWSRLFSLVHILLLCMFLQIEPRCFMSTISLL